MVDEDKNVKKLVRMLVIKVISIVLVAVIFASMWWVFYKNYGDGRDRMDYYSSEYQAVFLSNSQVYFGKIVDRNSENIYLEEVYYLKVDSEKSLEEIEQEADMSILRIVNDIHGPEDSVELNKDNVLYVENLREDSEIVNAIQEYKGGN